jgi:hypothetical protein
MQVGRSNPASFYRVSGTDKQTAVGLANGANFDIDLTVLLAPGDIAFVIISTAAGVGTKLALVGRDMNNDYTVVTLIDVTAAYLPVSIFTLNKLRINNAIGSAQTINVQFLRLGIV